MTNQHIKTIHGHRYWYSSIRIGKKVTSKYLGPVDARKRATKRKKDMVVELPEFMFGDTR